MVPADSQTLNQILNPFSRQTFARYGALFSLKMFIFFSTFVFHRLFQINNVNKPRKTSSKNFLKTERKKKKKKRKSRKNLLILNIRVVAAFISRYQKCQLDRAVRNDK